MMDKLKILKNKGAGVFSSVLEKLHEMKVSTVDKFEMWTIKLTSGCAPNI